MKEIFKFSAAAVLSLTCQIAGAAQPVTLFSFPAPVQPQASGQQAVAPNFTIPNQGYSMMYGMVGYGMVGNVFYIKSIRAAGVLDMVLEKSTGKFSARSVSGQRTLTQTCSTEFRNPVSGALVYATPGQQLVSAPVGLNGYAYGYCGASPATQARNPLGLILESVVTQSENYVAPKYVFSNSLKMRVMDGGTKAIKWSGTFNTTVALGSPQLGELVDVNNDGTDELAIIYIKDVTPIGFIGTQTKYSRELRNLLTGVLISTFSWVGTQPN